MTPTLQRLTARGRALAQRLKPQSASSRNVLKLAGGTAVWAEALLCVGHIYLDLTLLNVVSSLRYELAIAMPDDDDEAVALVWLCFGL
jgi:hypothetical protein